MVSGGFWDMIILGDGGKKLTLSQFRGRLVSEEGVGSREQRQLNV